MLKYRLFILFLIGLLCCNIFSFAQQATLTGFVFDNDNNQALKGAHILLKGNQTYASISDNSGKFEFNRILNGNYLLRITFLGYKELEKEVSIPVNSGYLGNFKLSASLSELGEAIVKASIPLATIKGDTIEYNADAYTTNPDADADDLVKKMPGITVEEGEVSAQGEKVRKVYVDGKPFFDQDPALALKTLPAEVIQKIEVFDEQSEQAQFTGFDDGETNKVMNIITRVNMKNGQFGKAYAGAGYPDKYSLGGNVNYFDGDRRISLIGLSNNINQQNFSNEDLLGVVNNSGRGGRDGGGRSRGGARGGGGGRPSGGGGMSSNDYMVGTQPGISKTHSLGINYTDKWGEKISLAGSYFINSSDNTSTQDISQNYFSDQVTSNLKYSENNQESSTNLNHRFHLKLDYDINENNRLMMRPRLSLQANNSLSDVLGKSWLGDSLLNVNTNLLESDRFGANFSNNLVYMHKFNKKGRTISTNFDFLHNSTENTNYQKSQSLDLENNIVNDSLNQFSDYQDYKNGVNAGIVYTEPLSENGQLMLNAKSSYSFEDADKQTFNYDYINSEYNEPDSSLSNIFNTTYTTQEFGVGYKYRKDKTSFNCALNYQNANLKSSEIFPEKGAIDHNFESFLPSIRIRYRISGSRNLNVRFRSNTRSPRVNQLQNTFNISNPLQVSTGNPDLKQSFNNSLFIRYSSTNPEKAHVFFVMCGIQQANNYIANNTYFAPEDTVIDNSILLQQGAQLIKPVNLDNYWSLNMFTTYGFPIKPIKSNMNISLQYNYVNLPGIYNNIPNYSKNNLFGISLVLSSKISEKIDYTITSKSSYNIANSTIQGQTSNNYLNQNTKATLNLILWKGIVFNTQVSSQYYYWEEEDYSQNYLLWNVSLGKQIFKNQLGQLKLSLYDILNQNKSLVRNVTDAYVEDIRTDVLQRFLMVSFTYRIRNFQKES